MAFPVSPTEGQTYTENNTVWIYSSTAQQWFRSQVNPENETFYKFGGSASATGAAGEIQYTDGTNLAASPNLVWDDVNDELEVGGDVVLDDGGTFTTTLQTITPTANRTVSLPNATGTVALVAGSSGQVVWNNAGANAGASTLTYDGSILTTSGRFINSYNATASAPAKVFTGTWFTGGTSTTTKPQVLIEPTGTTSTAWSTSGTALGINGASGFAGKLLDLQVNGTSQFSVDAAGGTGVLCVRLQASNRVDVTNLLLIGSSTILSPGQLALGTAGAADTIFARDAANTFAQRNGTNAQTFRVYNTYTSATNYELGKLEWTSNVFRIGTEAGSGGGTARALELQTNGTTRVTIGATSGHLTGSNDVYCGSSAFIGCNQRSILSSPADGVMRISNYAVNDFNRLQFGGTTSSFPALKRSSAVLETKLADDSAYAQHAASVFQAATAHTVATLPATPTVGMIARVTDATAPAVGATVTGGGSAAALCWYNGTNWTVIGV